jgi:zinc protease
VAPTTYPPLVPLNGQQFLLVDRDDLKQSEIRLGHYGVKRKNDDYQAVMVADIILSEGFNSRLMREIRVKRGLTYGIHTSFDALKDVGPFTVSSNTRNEKVGELVEQTIKVLEQFHDQGVTAAEVEEAKGYLRGTFPTRIETADDLASLIVSLRYYGIDESYLENYVNNLNKLTVDDINKIIKKYFHPNNMRVLVYAPKDAVIEQLRPLGAVEVKPYKELVSGL